MAAAMFESLIKNHPFVDGNKRVAFFATDVFLRLNAYRFNVEAQETYKSLMQLFENNECDMQHLQPWISASIIKLDE
jgi:death-on-curing protein